MKMKKQLEKIDLELTNACNLKCKHCYANSNSCSVDTSLSFPQVKKIIEEFVELGGKRVAISGGEPLLHKNFEEIFSLIASSGLKIELETNGTLINKKLIKKISNYKKSISYVQISLDGPNAKTHDKIRGKKGAFNKTIRAIKLCVKENITVRVSTVLTKENKNNIIETADLVRKIGVSQYRVDASVPIGREKKGRINPEEYVKIINKVYKKASNNNKNADIITPRCGVGETRVAILSNGLITPCPMIRTLIAGNAFNPGDLSKALDSKAVISVRKGLENSCGSCDHEKTCGRGCKARAFALTGNLNSPDPFRCAFFINRSVEGL